MTHHERGISAVRLSHGKAPLKEEGGYNPALQAAVVDDKNIPNNTGINDSFRIYTFGVPHNWHSQFTHDPA